MLHVGESEVVFEIKKEVWTFHDNHFIRYAQFSEIKIQDVCRAKIFVWITKPFRSIFTNYKLNLGDIECIFDTAR